MIPALVASNILLWIIVILLLVVIYALVRQIGVLHERVAPVGAMMPVDGPRIGELLTPVEATSLDGSTRLIGSPSERRRFLFFLSPGCPVCKSLLPVVRELTRQEPETEFWYASDGVDHGSHVSYAEEQGMPLSTYLVSRELGVSLGVSKLPFAVLISKEGVLRGRGLVNSREHLESLLVADEMDVPTLQEYLGISIDKETA